MTFLVNYKKAAIIKNKYKDRSSPHFWSLGNVPATIYHVN